MAMRLMGEQFVTGETISEALANSRKQRSARLPLFLRHARRGGDHRSRRAAYYASYEQAIHAIGKAAGGRGIYEGPGISIKLSALHPRYARSQRTHDERTAAAREALAMLARRYDIGLNIDAEEADRLEICRSICWKRCASIRSWRAGTASASSCRPIRSAARSCSTTSSIWRAAAVTAHDPPGQGRLLG
jgi:RHH-type proline utilization regulon transcriptional repressor/proline dehydrogenase/delta 1-pyrroline-5-carboxylate dehydrogenase